MQSAATEDVLSQALAAWEGRDAALARELFRSLDALPAAAALPAAQAEMGGWRLRCRLARLRPRPRDAARRSGRCGRGYPGYAQHEGRAWHEFLRRHGWCCRSLGNVYMGREAAFQLLSRER